MPIADGVASTHKAATRGEKIGSALHETAYDEHDHTNDFLFAVDKFFVQACIYG
jgi:hypothetical protein